MNVPISITGATAISAATIDISGIFAPPEVEVAKEEKGETQPSPLLPVSLPTPAPAPALGETDPALLEDGDIFTPAPQTNPVIVALQRANLYLRDAGDGRHEIACPWACEHREGSNGPATYLAPTRQLPSGAFSCSHHTGPSRGMDDLLEHLNVSDAQARGKGRIRLVAGETFRIVERAERVLQAAGGFYQSGGSIVTIRFDINGDVVTAPATEHAIAKALSLGADWEQEIGSKKWKRCDPPANVIRALSSGQTHEHLPQLDRIARQPYFEGIDGRLNTTVGYDGNTRTFGAFAAGQFPEPGASEQAARDALSELGKLLEEFPFASEQDRSAALCGMLTAAVRPTLPVAPAFNIRASTSGTGKSYAAELLAAFAGPSAPLNMSYPSSSEEATKAMLAALTGKPAVISFDDMQTDWLPYGMMNRMLTSETVADRVLGSSNTRQASTNAFILGTGNNIGPVRDMCRRVVTISLTPSTGSPATQSYVGDPLTQVRADRGKYVSLALTIINAWRHAGSPTTAAPSIGTFGIWAAMCRQPLLWLGLPDPAASLIDQIRSDPDAEAFGHLLKTWRAIFGGQPMTVRKLLEKAASKTELDEALSELPIIEQGRINSNKLGWLLKRNADRIIDGRYVRKEPHTERNAWSVQLTEATAREEAKVAEAVDPTLPVMIDGEIF